MDVLTGQPSTRQTVDADELLYWIVDDAARAIAWNFAYRSPAARGGDRGPATVGRLRQCTRPAVGLEDTGHD